MIDTETIVYSALSTNASLLALIGDDTHISSSHPENITVFPYIIFREEKQQDALFGDDFPQASITEYVIDVYVKQQDTYPYAKAIWDIFYAMNWVCDYNSDVPEPDVLLRHRVMRFQRRLMAGDV